MSQFKFSELDTKNSLCSFIRTHFVLEGEPHMIDLKVRDIAVELYELIEMLTKD